MKVTLAWPSAPGKSEIVGGSTVAQAPLGPTTSNVNSSTTVPVLRRRRSTDASWPGSTRMTGTASVTIAPTAGVYPFDCGAERAVAHEERADDAAGRTGEAGRRNDAPPGSSGRAIRSTAVEGGDRIGDSRLWQVVGDDHVDEVGLGGRPDDDGLRSLAGQRVEAPPGPSATVVCASGHGSAFDSAGPLALCVEVGNLVGPEMRR